LTDESLVCKLGSVNEIRGRQTQWQTERNQIYAAIIELGRKNEDFKMKQGKLGSLP
jgi:hypothetical protein